MCKSVYLHSITDSGLISGGLNSSRERHTLFFTVVNPMNKEHRDTHELDFIKPRLASYEQKVEKTTTRSCNVELFELCETFQMYCALTVFFIGFRELCTALADNA